MTATETIMLKEIRVGRRTLEVLLSMIIIGVFWLLIATPEQRYIVLPILVIVTNVLWFIATLWNRDRTLPLFDVGVICVLAMLVYTTVPLFNYMAGGLQFTKVSDARLHAYRPTPFELGAFHWRHVFYVFFFTIVYATARGKYLVKQHQAKTPNCSIIWAIAILALLFAGYLLFLRLLTGSPFGGWSYKEKLALHATGMQVQLPLVVRQISHYFAGMFLIFKLALMMIVIQHCHRRRWRIALYLWLTVEIVFCIYKLGSRTDVALLLMAAGILYHRLVKPLKLGLVLVAGFLLLAGFFAYGIARDNSMRTAPLQAIYPDVSILNYSNEFQSLLGTSYDLYQRRQDGSLQVPWQLYASDCLMLVPQQICPIEKIDPSQWYLRLIGLQNTGAGLMFGVISQAIVGLDWLELALRGVILGFILARIHRWYLRNSYSFFVTLFYVWLCIRIYYSFRASTFYLMALVVYEIIPAFLLIKTMPGLLRFLRPNRGTARVQD
jgi:hypothetical protein